MVTAGIQVKGFCVRSGFDRDDNPSAMSGNLLEGIRLLGAALAGTGFAKGALVLECHCIEVDCFHDTNISIAHPRVKGEILTLGSTS